MNQETPMRPRLYLVLAAAALLKPCLARAEPLEIRPGLWDMTTVANMSGFAIPPALLTQMGPQAQAMVQARMAAMSKPQIRQHCITKAMLAHGLDFKNPKMQDCVEDNLLVTARSFSVHAVCTFHGHDGPRQSEVRVHVVADSATHVIGTVDAEISPSADQPSPQKIHSSVEGSFKSDDCGSVLPDMPNR